MVQGTGVSEFSGFTVGGVSVLRQAPVETSEAADLAVFTPRCLLAPKRIRQL